MQKKKILPIIILSLFFSVFAPAALALENPQPDAMAVVLADMNSGTILYEKNMNQQRSPASLTKIMTGLLAVEAVERGDIRLEDIVTAPENCWEGMDLDSSNAEIKVGEQMTFKDFLYCALVKSANEACNVIAVELDGSIQAFVNRMNRRATELGAVSTYFSDPNGLSNENHYTTAYDLYLITREAMKHPLFSEAVDCMSYEIPPTNLTEAPRVLHNSNALICQDGVYGDDYIYKGASGVKTGYTNQAGYCLVSTAQREDISLVAVVLGCGGWLNTGSEDYKNFSQTIRLYDWAFDNFAYRDLITSGQAMQQVPVKYAVNGENAVLRATESITALVPKDVAEEDISINVTIDYDGLTAPIKAGTILGNADVAVNGNSYGSVSLTTVTDIQMERKAYIKERVTEIFNITWIRIAVVIIVAGLLLYLILIIRYKAVKRRHLMERAEAEQRRRAEAERRRNLEMSRKAQEEMRRVRQSEAENYEIPNDQTRRFTSVNPEKRSYEQTNIEDILRSLAMENTDDEDD